MPIEDIIVRIRADITDFNRVMNMTLDQFKKMNQTNRTIVGTGARVGNRFRLMTAGLRGFRMEMLGVLFFGLQVTAWMKGLITPSMELVGVFDLMNLTLGIGFLPNALALNDAMLKLMNWFLSLPEPLREFIGWFFIGVAIVGTFLFLIGMLNLALGSLIGGALLPVVGIGLAIIGAFALIITLWRNWDKISTKLKIAIFAISLVVGGLLLLIFPFIGGVLLAVAAIVAIIAIIKNWGKITDWFKEKWISLKDWFINIINNMIEAINMLIKGWNKLAETKLGKKFGFGVIEPLQMLISATAERNANYQDAIMRQSSAQRLSETNQNLTFAPTLNVTGVNETIDIEKIKQELNQQWSQELARLARQ